MVSAASVIVAASFGASLVLAELTFPTTVTQGNIAFKELGGTCGTGVPAYYGFMGGNGDAVGKKFFLEIMGGAVCFNKESCEDDWLGKWMDTEALLKEKFRMDAATWDYLESGATVPVNLPDLSDKAFFPVIKTESSNAFHEAPGIFVPTCTADIGMGRHDLNYTNEDGFYDAHHHGGINMNIVLQAVKRTYPNLEEFLIMGGSGGGVSSSVWMSKVAEMWPNAQVKGLVDSGFHMFPGSSFANFYYNNVQWGNGPGGDNNGRQAMPQGESLPAMDWRTKEAITDDLTKHTNLKVAYIACNRDYIVDSDRILMSKYSSFNGSSIQQNEEMWSFLTHLHQCAPAGSALSYVGDCDGHHLTKGSIKDQADITDSIPLSTFVNNFLAGANPDPDSTDLTSFWFEQQDMWGCNVPAPTPAPPPTPPITTAELEADSAFTLNLFGFPVWLAILALVKATL